MWTPCPAGVTVTGNSTASSSGSVTVSGDEYVPCSLPCQLTSKVMSSAGPDVRVNVTTRSPRSPAFQPLRSYSPTPVCGVGSM